jgi:hypothetical protein
MPYNRKEGFMKIKALDYLMVALIATAVAIGLAFFTRSITSNVHPIGILSLRLIEALTHYMIFYNLFIFIKGLFGKKQVWMSVVSAVVVALLIPIIYGMLFLIFEGEFSLNYPINTLILSFLSNVLDWLRLIVQYFTVTLFETSDVVGGLIEFILTVMLRFVQWILIPLSPLIFALRDVFKGDEEYRFVKAEVEVTHDDPV